MLISPARRASLGMACTTWHDHRPVRSEKRFTATLSARTGYWKCVKGEAGGDDILFPM